MLIISVRLLQLETGNCATHLCSFRVHGRAKWSTRGCPSAKQNMRGPWLTIKPIGLKSLIGRFGSHLIVHTLNTSHFHVGCNMCGTHQPTLTAAYAWLTTFLLTKKLSCFSLFHLCTKSPRLRSPASSDGNPLRVCAQAPPNRIA